jgi:tryptophan halogenase
MSETLVERLQMWKLGHPKKADFFSRFDLFDVDNYLYVLYGMKYTTKLPILSDYEIAESKAQFQLVRDLSKKLCNELPGHREWLIKLKLALASRDEFIK